MRAMEFLNNLRPAIPMSAEKPCTAMSNGELRRHIQSGAVLFNGEKVAVDEEIDFPVNSLVFFPKGKRKTTLI
jgi:tyrosyl-tRNA synthetase